MRKENIKLTIVISLLVVFSLSVTYAYLQLGVESEVASSEAGCFSVNYTGEEINTATLKSTPEYNEQNYSTVTLSKNANCEIYTEAEIRIHTNDSTTAPITGETQALKYKIKKISGSGQILSGGEGFVNQIGDITLATVSLTEIDTVYRVYLWIDSILSLGNYNNKSYSGYIYAVSAQTSTITPTITPTIAEVNTPNLDNGNLIPVYFDETEGIDGSWMKADSNNANNNWYDYDNKKWANAVIIADSTKKATYQSADVGTPIDDTDITAFYVWIPRFKYRVWNINRQGTSQDYYAYPAYSNGIQIEFENGISSTGNVICSYDEQTEESETYLSDNCAVNGTAISYNTSNLTYGENNQAWYTHPAFNFGDVPKTGFWIGKFETSGTKNLSTGISENPTILPDVQTLNFTSVSQQFMSAKNFQNYLQNSTMDAHMLTNLEWGALSYLTHSNYGLCNENSCSGMNNNNSSSLYTGRSSGNIADGTSSTYGTYDYKGYALSDNTPITNSKDITKVASTTKNITGVYDISGGSEESIMGNMVNSSKEFYPSDAGAAWEDTQWYDSADNKLYSKYYNSYAYGTNTFGKIAFNRARLGDATAEVLGSTSSNSVWKVGSGITGTNAIVVAGTSSWYARGGGYNHSNAGLFLISTQTGGRYFSFRSSLS